MREAKLALIVCILCPELLKLVKFGLLLPPGFIIIKNICYFGFFLLDKSLLMPRISSLVFIFLFTYPVVAQKSVSSDDLYSRVDFNSLLNYQTDYLRELYYQNVDNVDELVNGKDYIPYYFKSRYKPILFSDRVHQSSLILKGRRYDNLILDYDTFGDELIYWDSLKFIENKVFKLSMNKYPVDRFAFYFGTDSLFFRYFSKENDLNFNLPGAFYEVVYDGKSKFIIRHRSYLLVKEGIDEYMYSPADYIMVNDGYVKITNKRVFLKLFGDRSDDVKKFIRVNKVRIRKADKNEITAVLRFYDSLILSDL